jgi:hypothetical protein
MKIRPIALAICVCALSVLSVHAASLILNPAARIGSLAMIPQDLFFRYGGRENRPAPISKAE